MLTLANDQCTLRLSGVPVVLQVFGHKSSTGWPDDGARWDVKWPIKFLLFILTGPWGSELHLSQICPSHRQWQNVSFMLALEESQRVHRLGNMSICSWSPWRWWETSVWTIVVQQHAANTANTGTLKLQGWSVKKTHLFSDQLYW